MPPRKKVAAAARTLHKRKRMVVVYTESDSDGSNSCKIVPASPKKDLEVISLSSGSDMFEDVGQPILKLKHIQLSQICADIPDAEHIRLTGKPKPLVNSTPVKRPKKSNVTSPYKITKNTNLKRISMAQQPIDQTPITKFFSLTKSVQPINGYFDTYTDSVVSQSATKTTSIDIKDNLKNSSIDNSNQEVPVQPLPSPPNENGHENPTFEEALKAMGLTFDKLAASPHLHLSSNIATGSETSPPQVVPIGNSRLPSTSISISNDKKEDPPKLFETDVPFDSMEVNPPESMLSVATTNMPPAIDDAAIENCLSVVYRKIAPKKIKARKLKGITQPPPSAIRRLPTDDEIESCASKLHFNSKYITIGSDNEELRETNCNILPTTKRNPLPSGKHTTIAPPKKVATRKKGRCPSYKVVEGTSFAVDAFRYGDIEGVTTYFLTHYHADHYIGLKKAFNKPLHLSKITGRLVQTFIHIDRKYIHEHEIDVPFHVNEVEIVPLDANHCPGAVMFLFKFKTGLCTLHVGDFRASADMELYPQFWNSHIDTIYLDTTYLNKNYNFQSQMDSIDEAKREVKKFLKKNIGAKYLILVGAYVIGKEKVWMAIAEHFQMKVWLEPHRRKTINCIFRRGDRILDLIVDRIEDATIHVLSLGSLTYKFLAEYIKDYESHVLLAIRPSGWETYSKNSYGSRISMVGIEYSEHSSYGELERFVKFIQPKKIISTVPNSHMNQHKTPQVPASWLSCEVKPQRKAFQESITNYFVPKSDKSTIATSATHHAIPVKDDVPVNNHETRSANYSTDYMS